MDNATRDFVLGILGQARDLTLATIRQDGYPQATTVSYANDGLTIYVGIGKDSQKADNIRHNNKVSLTVNADYTDWREIKGVSMGAVAEILSDPADIRRAGDYLLKRFPQAAEWASPEQSGQMAFLKIEPRVISVLNYEKGFGHTDLVTA